MEVTMKRFILCMLLCSAASMLQAALMLHTPAPGSLLLGDNGNAAGIQRGIIMNTLLGDPNFKKEALAIKKFLGLDEKQQIPLSYQQIMQLVQQSTNAELSIPVLEAFEKTLLHQYHYDNYLIGSYQPWQSIFFTGIKYSWVNPTKWFNPTEWMSSNTDPNLNQILTELAFIARVAQKHSIVTSTRMSATIESYRNWKRNMGLTIVAYLGADVVKRGFGKSSLYDLYAGGLSNSPAVVAKFSDNIYSGARFVKKATITGAAVTSAITKPIVNAILYGAQPTITPTPIVQTKETAPVVQPKEKTPRWRDYWADTASSYATQVNNRFYGK